MESVKLLPSDSDDDSDDDIPLKKKAKTDNTEVEKDPGKFVVKVKEFNQVTKRRKVSGREAKITNGDRTYHEAKPPANSRATSVYNDVEQGSILWQFASLTQAKSIPQEDANWIAFTAEVWLKADTDTSPVGVEKMNEELGFKMVPVR